MTMADRTFSDAELRRHANLAAHAGARAEAKARQAMEAAQEAWSEAGKAWREVTTILGMLAPNDAGDDERPRGARPVDHIPSHRSPPQDGEGVYVTINRSPFYVWPSTYTGAEIRRFQHPPIRDDYDLWLVGVGEDDRLIRDDETIAIDRGGIRLFSSPHTINAGAPRAET